MKTILYATFLALISLSSCTSEVTSQSVVFMENIKVFEEFDMKKDYDKKIGKDLNIQTAYLDSIEILINKESVVGNENGVKSLQQHYYQKQEEYNSIFQELSSKYTGEVNARLNEYLKTYASENNYNVILGSGGQGNVMYIDEADNITEDLIVYINKMYSK